jgi:hypothetical protein
MYSLKHTLANLRQHPVLLQDIHYKQLDAPGFLHALEIYSENPHIAAPFFDQFAGAYLSHGSWAMFVVALDFSGGVRMLANSFGPAISKARMTSRSTPILLEVDDKAKVLSLTVKLPENELAKRVSEALAKELLVTEGLSADKYEIALKRLGYL